VVSRFAVSLPGKSAREREDAADKLAVTAYLAFDQIALRDHLGGVAPSRARDVVGEIVASLAAVGPVTAATAGLTQVDQCRVSKCLREARSAAAGFTSPAPEHVVGVLETVRMGWDRAHPAVPVSDEDLAEVLTVAASLRAKERAKALRKRQEAAQQAAIERERARAGALAARVAERAGLDAAG
jgi:hypothetical protein